MNEQKELFIKALLYVLVFLAFAFSAKALVAQEVPISFWIENVESYIPQNHRFPTPWMFDLDDPGYLTQDANPFSYHQTLLPVHNHAYKYFYSTDDPGVPEMDPTSSLCTAENLNFVNGTNGFRVEFENFVLTGLQKMNMVNPGAAWNIAGQAGDIRTYTGGVGKVYHNDGGGERLVLRVTNCVLKVYVNYPNAVQMRELVPTWQTNVGTGAATEVDGWGIVDIDNSDFQWANVFANPEAGNRIDFVMDTVDHVIQGNYGYYSFNLGLVPSPHAILVEQAVVPVLPGLVPFPSLDLEFNFSETVHGGNNVDISDLVVFQVQDPPQGIIPEEVEQMLPEYWHFTTNLESFSTDIKFDLSGKDFGDPANWFVMRKGDLENTWTIWADVTVLGPNTIQANNVSAFSDWTVGSSEEPILPVVLSSFNATQSNEGFVSLSWVTQSETNVYGYSVLRSTSSQLSEATMVSGIIPGTNTALAHQYHFSDYEVHALESYYYWLQQTDLNGNEKFFGPLAVTLTGDPDGDIVPDFIPASVIHKVFPNPATKHTIDYSISKDADVSITIYNARGQTVREISKGYRAKGNYNAMWDGRDMLGRSCASGIYYVELLCNDQERSRSRLLLIK